MTRDENPSGGKAPRRILMTAALPYANGPIHIGHLVEYIQADIWARFQRLRGHECVFVCADDTHGTPIMVNAQKLGITPEQLIAAAYQEHTRDFAGFQVEFDHYHSTNSEENRILSEQFFLSMQEKGHIHARTIDQLYCEHDRMFLPDRFVKGVCPSCCAEDQYGDSCEKCGATYSPTDLESPRCAICGSTPHLRPSEHLFFRLADFKEDLSAWVPQHTPPDISKKMQEWLTGDLRDWDISRTAPYFGFQIPGHPDKYFYVWLDAPIGYIAATWAWCKKTGKDLGEFWKSPKTEIYHFIGKDIAYFHTLFWPATLKAAGYQRPSSIFVHGHLMFNGEKMSKSRGTFIAAHTYLKHLDPMYLRFYYATKLGPSADDLDFAPQDFVNRVNAELVGKITNLGSRGAQMLQKRLDGRLTSMSSRGREVWQACVARLDSVAAHYEKREFAKALAEVREMAESGNRFFDEVAPWKTLETDPDGTRAHVVAVLNIFRTIAITLAPVLPEYAVKAASLFDEKWDRWEMAREPRETGSIREYAHLAQRIEMKQLDAMIEETKRMNATPPGTPPGNPSPAPSAAITASSTAPADPWIDIDLFSKVDLRVARIVKAEAVPDADKLLRLTVELEGGQTRNIFAGIKSAYDPGALEGRLTVIVANLRPRKMKFGLSEGMVLAAGPGGKDLFILSPDAGAKPGDRVK